MSSSRHIGDRIQEVTVVAPINIALVKYWGKRDEDLMLPLNDSISLSINDVFARTIVRVGPSVKKDSVSINGSDVSFEKHPAFPRCFKEVRRLIRKRSNISENAGKLEKQNYFSKKLIKCSYQIVSETSFPIQAGLASSAAGFAAIAYGLGQIYQLNISDIVRVARMGSGSACRSILSGLVHWKAGNAEDGADCICETVYPENYWPSLRSLILVTSRDTKKVGSSNGMQSTVKTSKLLQARMDIVPEQITKLKNAFRDRNFEEFAEVVMSDSGQLHAICMDTMPSLRYLSDNSWYLMRLIHALNRHCKSLKVAYTFDAGPNCCLFLESVNVPLILAAINKYCKLQSDFIEQVAKCSAAFEYKNLKSLVEEQDLVLFDGEENSEIEPMEDTVKDVFLSCVGAGPMLVEKK
uniref:Diphosphomevalonate decarboxylase n=1 Tax=Elaeophora elaphi TaxID=1147741 RepID=A0A0R3RWP2_9BILA